MEGARHVGGEELSRKSRAEEGAQGGAGWEGPHVGVPGTGGNLI